MIGKYKVLAVICARGGSKGVKGKNFRKLDGKPVICYSLDLLKKSRYVDDYIISTDSDEMIEIVKDYGFEIKFKRPAVLAGDKVSRADAVRHAVKWLEIEKGFEFDIIADLGVATPLKSSGDLDGCIELLVNSGASNVFSVMDCSRNPYYNMVELNNGIVKTVKPLENEITDRRDAPKVFDMNDAFNVWRHDVLFWENHQMNAQTKIYVMPRERSVDIDDEFDFIMAECIKKYYLKD